MRMFEAAAARRASGAAVFDLSAGQPGTPAPAAVRAAARRALDAHQLGYTASSGIPELREAIAGHYRRVHGLDVSPGDVVATTGSSGAFLLAFLAAFDAGDVVALARPGYPAYRNLLRALGCTVVELPCDSSSRFQPTVELLETLDPRPAGLVLASPANPTGTMVSADELARLARWCAGHGVRLISDEIYHGITYVQPAASAWQYDRGTVVVNSFSKYFSMTGWRLGWLLAPPDLLDTVDRLAGNFALCPPTLAQHAAVHAFDDYAELDANVARYGANREHLLSGLGQLGIDRLAPADGAFYAYADVSAFTDDTLDFCSRMLRETGVATTPGVDFDGVDGHRFLRASFAGSPAVVSGALDALADWLPGQRRA
ncbi:MAG: aminotransferase class I/II-fold pyridoxal phosphate-dependent enzyme [bacterium]